MRYYGFQNEVKSYLNRLERENGFRISTVSAKILNDRVESLKKSGIWAQYGLGFNDADGDAYLTRANVTDLIGRSEVLWFIRGMKSLGLYSNMVAWPMRSYQNAGTGSTAFCLGGYGRYDGTLTNGPTWGRNGILFGAGNNQRVTTTWKVGALDSYSIVTAFNSLNGYVNSQHLVTNRISSSDGTSLIAKFNNTTPISYIQLRFSASLASTNTTSYDENYHIIKSISMPKLYTAQLALDSNAWTTNTGTPATPGIPDVFHFGNETTSLTRSLNGNLSLVVILFRKENQIELNRVGLLSKSVLANDLGLP